jgi:hypothetical protein
MMTKAAIIIMFTAIEAFTCTAASAEPAEGAGSVEVGLIDEARVAQWMAGGAADFPSGEIACIPAKFEHTSKCGTVVISNNSARAITLKFASDDNEDFSVGVHGAFMNSSGPQPCYESVSSGRHLNPGARCYAPVEFWPRTGEAQRATVHVTVTNADGSITTSFRITGTSDYPPELQAAEEVRQRHAVELMKIPHVASVELDDQDGIRINITVDAPTAEILEDEIEEVRKQVPPKIEGYDTEVKQYVHHGYLL